MIVMDEVDVTNTGTGDHAEIGAADIEDRGGRHDCFQCTLLLRVADVRGLTEHRVERAVGAHHQVVATGHCIEAFESVRRKINLHHT